MVEQVGRALVYNQLWPLHAYNLIMYPLATPPPKSLVHLVIENIIVQQSPRVGVSSEVETGYALS